MPVPQRCIALLRGVNLGGNKKVPMAELKRLVEELGFTDVIVHWPRPDPPYRSDLAVLEDYLASLGTGSAPRGILGR